MYLATTKGSSVTSIDPEKVRLLHVKLSANEEVEGSDVSVELSGVKSYRRRIGGRWVEVGGYNRQNLGGRKFRGLPTPNTNIPHRLAPGSRKPPEGSKFKAITIAMALLQKWRAGQRLSPADQTKSHQAIVEALMAENSPLVRELRKKIDKGDLSPMDRQREYAKIAIQYLRLLSERLVKATYVEGVDFGPEQEQQLQEMLGPDEERPDDVRWAILELSRHRAGSGK